MPASFWDNALILIFFAYGLAFYSLGLTLWVESGRASELGFARSMRLIAAFGLLHGLHEWLDMLERGLSLFYSTALPPILIWSRVTLLVTSFIALLAFGEHLLAREQHGRAPSWRLTIGLTALFVVSSVAVQVIYRLDDVSWNRAIDVLSRYLVGIPGALVACWALWRQRAIFRERGIGNFSRELTWAALALALYGGVGQIFVGPSAVFPSMYINNAVFLQAVGFPVQLFRAALAIIIAIALIRVLRALEVENEQRLEAAKRDTFEAEYRSREELTRLNTELQAANAETERLYREVQRRDAVRGELLQRITAAQEAERKRIARELHDETGQTLTGIALGLRGVAAMNDPVKVAQRLGDLEGMATASLDGLRRMINDLRPPQLDDIGLAAALRFMLERMNHHSSLAVHFEINVKPRPLPAEVETLVFRIAQEGLNNIVKHAQASEVWIDLDYDEHPSLTIRDNGIGFEPGTADGTAWGLMGMQERANLLNATLSLESAPGQGTMLTVRLNDEMR